MTMSGQNSFYLKSDSIMITKSNTLVEACYDLSVAEHDLMTLAINKMHKQPTGTNKVTISAKEFATANKVTDNYAYKTLKDTAKTLAERKLKFPLYVDNNIQGDDKSQKLCVLKPNHKNFTLLKAEYHWLQGISYQDQEGYILLHFSDPLAFLIEHTNQAYTKYDYIKTVNFKGFSSKRMYELISKWKDLGKTPEMTVFEWKEYFGVADSYPKVAEFKRRVLDPAIKQINEQGEFKLILTSRKEGRGISHFMIKIKVLKKSVALLPVNAVSQSQPPSRLLTSAQADMFAKKLANDTAFGSKFARVGESNQEFAIRISHELQRDIAKITDYMSFLNKHGYK